tara:strand:+ start:58 stop:660 length:603 start_codon:yes stop_codon:yes gene_type:complete
MISSILLAAGQSSRMNGENKLTKKINGIPLIKYVIKNILGSAIDELIIVLGYEKEIVENLIVKNKKIKLVYNSDFKNGLSTSIKTGLHHISKKSKAFFVCLGDMPDINQNIYNKLIKSKIKYDKKSKFNYEKKIFIPTCNNIEGNPVLFSISMKKEIMEINGDNGAKNFIELNRNRVLHVPFKNDCVLTDFDTQENFKSL